MEMETLLINLIKRKALIFAIIVSTLLIMTIITFVQPLKYSVTSRLLISQSLSGADPYTVSKSNQYLTNLFSQVIHSSSFFDLASNTGFNIDKSYFGYNYKKQIKTWNKTIEARSIGDTGIIEILIYHPNTYQAQQIALAVNQVLINQNSNYQKGGEDVTISVIDQPLVTSYPVKPNIIINTFFAIVLGLAIAIFYVYFFPIKTTKSPKFQQNKSTKQEKQAISQEEKYYPPINLPTTNEKLDDISTKKEVVEGNISNIIW